MRFHTIPLNAGDFLARTAGMAPSDFGAHTRLYIHHFQIGETGLRDDNQELARICGLNIRTFRNCKSNILRGFEKIDQNGISFWIMPEIIKTLQDAQQKSDTNRANSLRRWENQNAVALPLDSNRKAIQDIISKTKNTKKENLNFPPKLPISQLPDEQWKRDILTVVGEVAYITWIKDMELIDGFIICPNTACRQFMEQNYEFELKRAIGNDYKGLKIKNPNNEPNSK